MLSSSMERELTLDYSQDKFAKAFAFLKENDLDKLAEGCQSLGSDISVSVQRYMTSLPDLLQLETHDKFYDIQYVISGEEIIEVCGRSGLAIKTAYDEKKDISFYYAPAVVSRIVLRPGDFVILAPEEAHRPRCGVDRPVEVKKIVIKIPV